ncbi:MAG: TIGR04290 family methyltransferase [Myxococcales bacterium]
MNLSASEIQAQVNALGDWFHNIDLNGVKTAPNHFLGDYPGKVWKQIAHELPQDLTGKSVLDIGCNAGFFSFEMKKRGAARVVGLDSDERYLAQGRFAAKVLGVDVEFRQGSVYEVGRLRERFDVVLFMGVLYHLRHPLLALDLIHEHVAKDTLIFQSMQRGSSEIDEVRDDYTFEERDHFDRPGYPKMHFIEKKYCGDQTNWWAPNRACVEAMLRSAGFQIVRNPEWTEIYICRRTARPVDSGPVLSV